MFYLKGKIMNAEDDMKHAQECNDLYDKVQQILDDKTIGDIIQVISYTLAEIAVENGVPKNEFVAHVVDMFDRAYEYQTESLGKGH